MVVCLCGCQISDVRGKRCETVNVSDKLALQLPSVTKGNNGVNIRCYCYLKDTKKTNKKNPSTVANIFLFPLSEVFQPVHCQFQGHCRC